MNRYFNEIYSESNSDTSEEGGEEIDIKDINDFEENEDFKQLETLNLDKLLKINENREPNKFGLYRLNCLIVGKTGSGKTTTLLKALLTDAIDDFDILIFIIPRESLESGFYKSLFTQSKNIPKQIVFIIIGEEPLPTVEELNDISKHNKARIALILDDFINAFKKDDWLVFKRYVTQLSRVEFGCSLFVLTQNLLEFPTTYRKNFNCFCLFVNSLTMLQFKDIVKSYYDYGNFNKLQLEELFNTFKKKAHTPLWLINTSDENKSMMYGSIYINPNSLF